MPGPASPAYNDGTVQYGTETLSISADGTTNLTTYIADNISVTRPAKVVERTNNIGEPTGSVGIRQFETGSATLQFASSTVKEPLVGFKFVITLDATGGLGSETWIITSVGRTEVKDGEKKCPINFIKQQN